MKCVSRHSARLWLPATKCRHHLIDMMFSLFPESEKEENILTICLNAIDENRFMAKAFFDLHPPPRVITGDFKSP